MIIIETSWRRHHQSGTSTSREKYYIVVLTDASSRTRRDIERNRRVATDHDEHHLAARLDSYTPMTLRGIALIASASPAVEAHTATGLIPVPFFVVAPFCDGSGEDLNGLLYVERAK